MESEVILILKCCSLTSESRAKLPMYHFPFKMLIFFSRFEIAKLYIVTKWGSTKYNGVRLKLYLYRAGDI